MSMYGENKCEVEVAEIKMYTCTYHIFQKNKIKKSFRQIRVLLRVISE